MKTSTMIGIGVAVGALLLWRSAGTRTVTLQTPTGPVSVQAPSVSASSVRSALASQRESVIQRLMANSHLSRADAEARYSALVPSVTDALTRGTSGLGGYVRTGRRLRRRA